jgi:histidinol-phosphatase (PHP family)
MLWQGISCNIEKRRKAMIIPDYHIHSSFSPDSKMEPEEAICAAIKAGITDLCFTEHMDLGHHMKMYDQVPDYIQMEKTLSGLQKKYPEIRIGKGIEVGYIPETVEQTVKVLEEQGFDYVLLSTHCVDGLDCGLPESKRGQDKVTAYKRYLETVYDSVTDERLLPYYDCVSHIGYIAKGLHYADNTFSYEMFPELFDKILTAIINNGKGIEVNTSGIDRGGHVLPHPSIMRRYRELGGRIITVGSDAHRSEKVGAYVNDAMAVIEEAGFKDITLFDSRELKQKALD